MGIEPGSDLESLFLELTGSGAAVHDRPTGSSMAPLGGPLPPSGAGL